MVEQAGTVSSLFVYPVKSLRGIQLQEAVIEPRGIRYDRRWMIVDQDGLFRSQRDLPSFATVKTEILSDCLRLTAGGESIEVPLAIDGPEVEVTIWQAVCNAVAVSPLADEWLTDFAKVPCRLVGMPDSTFRPVNVPLAAPIDQVGFADSSPILVVGEASLRDLNDRLEAPIPMNRFRPNIVVAGSPSYWEDGWAALAIGSTDLRYLKCCGRCAMTTIDQDTGTFDGKEPLQTLARFRNLEGKVYFGAYFVLDKDLEGEVKVGDPVVVKEKTPLQFSERGK